MERKNYLIDTNVAIYYFGLLLSKDSELFLESLFKNEYFISVINRIELLGFDKLNPDQYKALELFVYNATVFALDEAIVQETINIRRIHKTKTPDAIIAATCIVKNCTLITNNIKDFEGIEGLALKTLKVA